MKVRMDEYFRRLLQAWTGQSELWSWEAAQLPDEDVGLLQRIGGDYHRQPGSDA